MHLLPILKMELIRYNLSYAVTREKYFLRRKMFLSLFLGKPLLTLGMQMSIGIIWGNG